MKSASTAPVTTWPTVEPIASAPDHRSSACSWTNAQPWSRRSSICSAVRCERPVDEVLPELVDGLDGAGLHRVDHCRVICHTTSQSRPVDDREGADDRDDDGEPAGNAVAQHPGEGGPQQRGDEDRDEQRDDEQLQLDDEPDADADRRGDDEEPPRVGGRDAQAARDGGGGLGRDDPAAVAQGVEQRAAGLFVGAARTPVLIRPV